MKRQMTLALIVAASACVGCDTSGWPFYRGDYIKPTVAVLRFESKATNPLGWDIGNGMRDILVDRLVDTERFHVIERPEIQSVIRELQLQHSGATRKQSRSKMGRLKNVQYLVKGTVTDFGHVSTDRGFFGLGGMDLFGGNARAVMGMTLYVIDVESGEIIASESLEESVRAKDASLKAVYHDVAFGGSIFYRTPLGRATRKVIGKAVRRITGSIKRQPWQPKIALVQDDENVVINGGENHKIKTGYQYDVYDIGEAIVDPDTGDLIGHYSGRLVGRVRVVKVKKKYAVVSLVDGTAGSFRPGQHCRKVAG